MEENMKDIFLIINLIKKGNLHLKMERFMKEDFKMVKNKEMDR
jgi:hypothetical protein